MFTTDPNLKVAAWLILYNSYKVLLSDEVVSSLGVHLTVLDPAKVAHTTQYLISKHGGNITLDCTDLDGEDVNWTRVGGKG